MASITQVSVLVLLIVSATIMAVNADVVSLTDATFTDKLKEENSLWLIKFYAPWCGYCKRLAPTWEELGKALEQEDGVEVATVDCTTSKATCTKNDIRSYPTIKLFYNGEELKKYSGPRDLESMKALLLKQPQRLQRAMYKLKLLCCKGVVRGTVDGFLLAFFQFLRRRTFGSYHPAASSARLHVLWVGPGPMKRTLSAAYVSLKEFI